MKDPEAPISLKETIRGLIKSLKWRDVPAILFYFVLSLVGIVFYLIPKIIYELFKK